MNAAEESLRKALEAAPIDWSIRLLAAEKAAERHATEEVAALVASAPVPPFTEDQLYRAIELAGVQARPVVESFVAQHPANAYGHLVLGSLMVDEGDPEQAEKHFEVARALGIADAGLHPTDDHPAAGEDTSGETGAEPVDPGAGPGPVYESIPLEGTPPAPPPAYDLPPPPDGAGSPGDPAAAEPPSHRPAPRWGTRTVAVFVAIGVHLLIALIAAILVILPPAKDEPEIVAAVIGPPAEKREMQKKNVVKQVKKNTSAAAAAAPVAQLMRSAAMARFSVPEVTKTSTGPLGMGEGNLGSGGFGGTGSGLGSGASFFGGTSTGNHFAFILDYSGSMKPNQVDMVVKEMDRSLKALKPGARYQVLLFAGGSKYAIPGWKAQNVGKGGQGKARNTLITDPGGKTYLFESVKNNWANFDFKGSDGSLPLAEWQIVSRETVSETMQELRKKELYGGTDWRWPFKMAMNHKPPPDVIFFMADGTGGAKPDEILSYAKRKNPRVQINMFAMETTSGAAEMAQIAKQTNGQHKIILRSGKTIEGEEVFKNKRSVEARIKRGR